MDNTRQEYAAAVMVGIAFLGGSRSTNDLIILNIVVRVIGISIEGSFCSGFKRQVFSNGNDW